MESFDLRDMVEDEIRHKKLDPSVIDEVVRYIKNSSRLLEMLDFVVGEAIDRCVL